MLLSGGLDSVVSLARADREMDVRLALFFDYGQRAVDREREAALGAVGYFGIPYREIDLRWLGLLAPSGMRKSNQSLEIGGASELDTLDAVWVPNRNGVFLNVAAAYAESYGCDVIVAGFNKEEAVEFPDNQAEYVDQVNACFRFSTRSDIRVVSFTQDLTKREILLLGVELGAPLSIIWSCYAGGEMMCGGCMSCKRLLAAMNSLADDKRPRLRFRLDTE